MVTFVMTRTVRTRRPTMAAELVTADDINSWPPTVVV